MITAEISFELKKCISLDPIIPHIVRFEKALPALSI